MSTTMFQRAYILFYLIIWWTLFILTIIVSRCIANNNITLAMEFEFLMAVNSEVTVL
jgi:predicted secreted protein